MLTELREEIDAINSALVALLAKRFKLTREIARIKKRDGLPILDPNREDAIKIKVRELAKEQGISPLVMEEIIQLILDYTRIEMEGV